MGLSEKYTSSTGEDGPRVDETGFQMVHPVGFELRRVWPNAVVVSWVV